MGGPHSHQVADNGPRIGLTVGASGILERSLGFVLVLVRQLLPFHEPRAYTQLRAPRPRPSSLVLDFYVHRFMAPNARPIGEVGPFHEPGVGTTETQRGGAATKGSNQPNGGRRMTVCKHVFGDVHSVD